MVRARWTKAKRATFLATLAATGKVTAAARAAGMSEAMARSLRKRETEFARAWDEALDTGYERLENELLAKALGPGQTASKIDSALALKVLDLRARRAQRGGSGATGAVMSAVEVDAVLLTRLDALAARRAGESEASP